MDPTPEKVEARVEELLHGPAGPSAFTSPAQREVLWLLNREALTATFQRQHPGRLPWAARFYNQSFF